MRTTTATASNSALFRAHRNYDIMFSVYCNKITNTNKLATQRPNAEPTKYKYK